MTRPQKPSQVQGRALACGLTLACGCDYTVLSTAAGKHIVYHWDNSEERLCGGTVATADAFVEAIPTYYGLSPKDTGPDVEYFWSVPGLSNACAGENRNACVSHLLSGLVLVTDRPIDTHELAHTVAGGHGGPDFLDEGLAVRWQSELLGNNVWRTSPSFIDEAELRAELLASSAQLDYAVAHNWWVALEFNYGPMKMGEFIVALGDSASAKNVEQTLQRVLDISLAESAELAANLPELLLDDPACDLAGLPTLVWNEEPLVVDRKNAHCEDPDLVNLSDQRVSWLFALEFPADWVEVDIEITVPSSNDPQRKMLVLTRCDGEPSFTDHMAAEYLGVTPPEGGTVRYMGGRYVAALWGDLRPDGAAELPRVVFRDTVR